MAYIQYVPKRFNKSSKLVIAQSNIIIRNYQAQGFDLTLRQLYYQFVAQDLFPDDRRWAWTGRKWVRDESGTKNAEPNYKWLGTILNDGRLAGLIDWDAIQDRTRSLRRNPCWDSPQDIISACAKQYGLDRWQGQKYRPEVWIEKDALVGVIEDICRQWDVPFFSCRGYTSQSEMWRAAQRLKGYVDGAQIPIIFHFGDHDPSGIDMSRDIQERLMLFLRVDLEDDDPPLEFHRLALTMDQIDQYEPPPNPTKLTDSRATSYLDRYGEECWELDALEPKVMVKLIDDAIRGIVDDELYDKIIKREETDRQYIGLVADRWLDLLKQLKKKRS